MAINFSSLGGTPKGNTASRPSNPSIGDTYYNGELVQLEIYTDGGWAALNVAPGPVTSASAANVGTSRAYNNGAATITFTEPAGSTGTAGSYTATSSPGSYTATSSTSPITVQGLQSGTAYTFTITGTNAYGTSSGVTTSSITATTVPDAPTSVSASATNSQASVSFTGGATGGSSITGYTVTSSPGNITATGASSPITVTGLTNGTAYTFTVKANNANGSSAASSSSNSVTPLASSPFSMSLPTASALYVADAVLSAGTYAVAVSPSATVYLSLLDGSGNTFYNGTVTNGANITLSTTCVKAAAFAAGVANVTLSVGTNPVSVTTTAAGAGTTTTLTSGTSYVPNSTGYAYVVALGGGQGGSSQDVPGNDGYGGHGGRAAVPTGGYVKLTSGSAVSYTVGAQGNGGSGAGGEGNAGGSTTWGNLLTAAGATVNGAGVAGGGTGGNSWTGGNGSVQPNPYSGIKSGTNGSGGGGSGNTGGTTVGGGSGIGTGGSGSNHGQAGGHATGYAAGGGGAGDDFASPGGNGSPGVIYVIGGLN